MSNASKDELYGGRTTLDGHNHDPVTAQARLGEKPATSIEPQDLRGKTSPSKEINGNPSKTASSISLAQRSIRDEEKGLPVDSEAVKESAVTTDTEHDPNIVDWDENDPENPLNWSGKKKW